MMVRGIRGHFHQGCNIFQPYNGMQCTAIALVALLMFMQHMPCPPSPDSPMELSHVRDFVDRIIVNGNELYREIVSEPGGPTGYLSHQDLPDN